MAATGLIALAHKREGDNRGLDNDVCDAALELVSVCPVDISEMLEEPAVGALAAGLIIVRLHKPCRALVQGVVCEVHGDVLDVLLGGGLVLRGGEANKAILVEVEAQRVTGRDEDVKAKVKLVPVDEKGLWQVLLHKERFGRWDAGRVLGDGDANPARAVDGLVDEGWPLLFLLFLLDAPICAHGSSRHAPCTALLAVVDVVSKVLQVCGQHPGAREDVEGVAAAHAQEAVEVSGQVVLARDLASAWEVVHPLVGQDLAEDLTWRAAVEPEQVAVHCLWIEFEPEAELLAHLFHHVIVCVCQVGAQRLSSTTFSLTLLASCFLLLLLLAVVLLLLLCEGTCCRGCSRLRWVGG